ncbi:helix-turn-helix domain-containing protein [Periweissella fabalis]|uniref:Helix-turn-helix domain-containing protein n=1 Tax=Periweissella fabalis TaxID=1070421 RepID=A0A7X6N3Y7_9LACO|nr:helix-turn-helix transcriptional regulator [Periweissella fabalis]MCM0598674.1 DUF4115 domain-containing protein [Periweissella fabalis]NKZ24327.1 helix-turn-helix domain-containing protein [Periweissella fabalis]
MSEQRNIEIGEKLRAARLEKGFTLDDIQQSTKIQKRYLNAIENGDFDQLPGDFYVRAFTKQFAQAVGIDADELLVNAPKEVIEPTTDLSNSRTDLDNVTRTGMDMEPTKADKIQSFVPKIIIGVLVVVVLLVIWVIANSLSTKSNSQQNADNSSVSVSSSKVNKADKVADSSSKASSEKKPTKKAKSEDKAKDLKISDGQVTGNETSFNVTGADAVSKDHTMVISSKNRTWVTVRVNGSSVVNQMIQAGDSKEVSLPANTTAVKVTSGFATGTSIQLDKQDVNIPDSSSLTRNYDFNFAAGSDAKDDN